VEPQDLIDRLSQHRTLGSVPPAELEWLAAHGVLRRLDPGDILSVKGHPVAALYIILSGRLALFVDRGNGPDKIIEWREGDVSGLLPYSRLSVAPGDSRALEPLELLAIPRDLLQAMTRECFHVTSILVHTMVDRTRLFTSGDLQNEKMVSLGKLSAGLAHELNNPASAIQRCVAVLEKHLEKSERFAGSFVTSTLSEPQHAALEAILEAMSPSAAGSSRPALTPLEQSDREETIAAWLTRHGADLVSADALAQSGVTLQSLDRLAASVPQPTLNALLGWLSASCAVRNLTARIHGSAAQISHLIDAVKGFTHMDQANAAEPVDVASGLASTVAVLQSKAREKSISVTLQLDPALPRVRGFAAELNQIWNNLIDNALDAAAGGGKVEVHAAPESHHVPENQHVPKNQHLHEDQHIIVRVIDDGPGIAEEIRTRVFDPFFTTKPQGQGIGLGLDIARRLARHNDGAIEFTSIPGRTEFRVRLPITARI
jgi:signal transduction histidine kinase